MKHLPINILIAPVLGLELILILLWLMSNQSGSVAPLENISVEGASVNETSALDMPRLFQSPQIQKVIPSQRQTNNITVCLEGSCDYTSIQAAIDSANDGDTIKIAAGIYTQTNAYGNFHQVAYISKTITLRGGYTPTNWTVSAPDTHPTILDAHGNGRVLSIVGDVRPIIEGLHLTGGNVTKLSTERNVWNNTGGGVFVITATAVFSRNYIYNNLSNSGGGVFLRAAKTSFYQNTIFSNTTVTGAGGGIEALESTATFISNTITTNTAIANYGGAIALNKSNGTFQDNLISHNTAVLGGAVYVSGGENTFIQNDILQNTATEGGGGGLHLYSARATFNHNRIISNTTVDIGGGLFIQVSRVKLNHNLISGNRANLGGGLYLLGDTISAFRQNDISHNTAADKGGGIYMIQSKTTVIGNTIRENKANEGGGLYVISNSDAPFLDNLIADNQAVYWGSGLYIHSSSPHLTHNTLARNHGGDGSGIYVNHNNDYQKVTLQNTILVSHSIGITLTAGSKAEMEATLWGSGQWANDSDWSPGAQITTGTINIWAEPDFVNPIAGDYHLNSTSPARDAGIKASMGQDIDGQPRLMDLNVDIGADEYAGVSLVIDQIPSAISINPGHLLTYTILITNVGGETATDFIFTNTLDAGQRMVDIKSSRGQCNPVAYGWGGVVRCPLARLAGGQTIVVTLTTQLSDTIEPEQELTGNSLVWANETVESSQTTTSYSQDCHVRLNNGPEEFTRLQPAIDAARPGDIIKVAGVCLGVDERAGMFQQGYIDKTITIRGGYTPTNWHTADPDATPTRLNALNMGRGLYITGTISPVIEGLHITGGDSDAGGGIYLNRAAAILQNMHIVSNTAKVGAGIYLADSAARLSFNHISWNLIYASLPENGGGGGVYLVNSPATLNQNVISHNTSNSFNGGGGGVHLSSSPATLTHNIISHNYTYEAGGGLYLYWSDAILEDNMITNNTASLPPNRIGTGGGLYLVSSKARLRRNTIMGNATLRSGGGLLLSFSDAELSENIISANSATSSDSYHGSFGGGLTLGNSKAVLNHNTISFNRVGQDSSGTFWGGGLYLRRSQATLNQNRIFSNYAASGGGLYLDDSEAILTKNSVSDNTATDFGGGIYLEKADNAWLDGNRIQSNRANTGGGLFFEESNTTLLNTVVAENQSSRTGAGLYLKASSPQLLHTTITQNTGGDGSGIAVQSVGQSTPSLTNTILVRHQIGISASVGTTITLEATLWGDDIWDNDKDWAGAGRIITGTINIWDHPDFGYWSTLPDSSVTRDAGIDTGITSDVQGEARPMGRGYDIGADEHPDVALQISQHPPLILQPEQIFTYTVLVTNVGKKWATNAIVTSTLDTYQRVKNAIASSGDCIIIQPGWGGRIHCTLDRLYPSATTTITLTAQVSNTISARQRMANSTVVTSDEINPLKSHIIMSGPGCSFHQYCGYR